MLYLFLLFEILLSRKRHISNNINTDENYQLHERIDDDHNQISLKKVIFSNFQNPTFNGGAIYINKNRFNTTLSNCKFENCFGKFGGAIYVKSKDNSSPQSCSIYNALFTNCRATNGGALYLKVGYTERHSITIEGCTFKINFASENGGAIYGHSREKLSIQRCRFENNIANLKGSSIWCLVGDENGRKHNKLILYRNSFEFAANENNLVNVYIQSNTLNDSNNANANVYLGLCSFQSTNESFTEYKNLQVFEDGKFESFNFTECNCIQGNEETVSIDVNTTTNYSNYLIYNCQSIDQCQKEFVVDPIPPKTEECVDYPNRIDYIGGSGIELGKSCFSNFISPIEQDGGAIHVINAQIDLEKCRFINCSTDRNGGAIFATIDVIDCEIEIEDCIFDNCQSNCNGGAVYVCMCEDYCEMEVDNTVFINCKSYQNGGAFFVTFDGFNCNLEFEDCLFDSCIANEEGGALYFLNYKASRSTFETCNFTNNKAKNAGAFYYSPFSYSKLCRCEFTNNTCTGQNCSSSVFVYINPNKSNHILQIKNTENETTNVENNDDGEDNDDNIDGDVLDNLTINNVVIADNVFSSDPIKETAMLIIDMKKNSVLLFGKNSFSFNNKDEIAEDLKSNYINVYHENDSNLTFKEDGFICVSGNSTSLIHGISNIEMECQITHFTFDYDEDHKKTEKKNKLFSIIGITFACVFVMMIAFIIIILIVVRKNKNLNSKSGNSNESVVNLDQNTTDGINVNI